MPFALLETRVLLFQPGARSSRGWHRVRMPATECPGISREFPEEDRRHQKGDFEMEYMGRIHGGRAEAPVFAADASPPPDQGFRA
jgi:hypothetical protein